MKINIISFGFVIFLSFIPSVALSQTKRSERLKMSDAIKENVTLTADQAEKIKALRNTLKTNVKKIQKAAAMTKEQIALRKAAVDSTPDSVQSKVLFDDANATADFNSIQVEAQRKIKERNQDWRFAAMTVLTAEQRKKMPVNFQTEFAKRSNKAKVKK